MSDRTQAKPADRVGFFTRMGRVMNRAMAAASYRFHIAVANTWRDHYNPLRSLTISRAVCLLEEGERGAFADVMWTYRYIEMQDATLGALVERRTSAIQKLDWDIKTRDQLPAGKEQVAARQAAALRAAYERIGNLSAALEFLAMATFRGYSHLEEVTDALGQVIELAPVDQWFWCRAGLYGEWRYNPSAAFGNTTGEEVPLHRFIIREVQRPINRVALVCFVRKGLSQKDWDGFIEAYGIPAVFIIMPDNVPTDKEEDYLDAAESVSGDSRGVLPSGTDVKTVDNGARGVNPFKEHIDYQDSQVVLRGTGGKLTMLTESGSGTLAGNAHSDTFDEIAKAEAKEISEVMRQQFDKKILDQVTPGEPAFAYFELAANEETDTKAVVADVKELNTAGYDVEIGWIKEKTGYPVTRKVAAVPALPGKAAAPRIMNRLVVVNGWKKFARETGTLGIPREVMPQINQGNRAAVVNFFRARGIDYSRELVKPADLKPTQAEYAPEKVEAAKLFKGTPRALLISSDNHVLDGHHQYLGELQLAPNKPIEVFRLKAPAMQAIGMLLAMPSTTTAEMPVRNREVPDEAAAAVQTLRAALKADFKPLGEALEGALAAGDEAAMRAALKKISASLPDLAASDGLTTALAGLMAMAFVEGATPPTEET